MANVNEPEVIPEDPNVVKGGPLDPTSAENKEKEAEAAKAGGETPPVVNTEPLHRGFVGEIKTPEELLAYTKNLEAMVTKPPTLSPVLTPTPPPQATTPSAKERFAELIYAKPDEAFDIAVSEAERRINEKNDQKENHQRKVKAFYDEFYAENPDLKNMAAIVQSVTGSRQNEIAKLSGQALKTFIATESRKMVDLVKKSSGVTETKLPSGHAVTLGASGEPAPHAPTAPAEPKNFTTQLRNLRPVRAKK